MSSTFIADTKGTTPPGPLTEVASVLQVTSLDTTGGQSARLSNLGQANVVSNVDRSAQNAVANQQAHAQLALSVLGQAVTSVQNLGPMEARSSVDILTNNEMAQTIADLKATTQAFAGGRGGGGRPGPVSLWRIVQRLILRINQRLEGDGSLARPFRILDQGPIFSQAPVSFAFPNTPAGSVAFTTTKNAVNVATPAT